MAATTQATIGRARIGTARPAFSAAAREGDRQAAGVEEILDSLVEGDAGPLAEIHPEFGQRLPVSHADEFAHTGLRTGVLAAHRELSDALVEQRADLRGDYQPRQLILLRATRQPSLTVPTTISSGTNTPSRNTSLNNASPVISRSGRIRMPGELISIRKEVIPLCFGASGSVRARHTPHCALCADDVHTFWPVNSQPPSTRTALVRRDARSEPASGSENSGHQKSSPRNVPGTKRSTCSGVPCSRMVDAAHQPMTRSGRATSADASS